MLTAILSGTNKDIDLVGYKVDGKWVTGDELKEWMKMCDKERIDAYKRQGRVT